VVKFRVIPARNEPVHSVAVFHLRPSLSLRLQGDSLGPEAERAFCGAIDDGGDRFDVEMARDYIAERIDDQMRAMAELARCHAARRLVTTPWSQARIRLLADQLLRFGTLTAEEVAGLAT
jgi:hypothetical protein